MDKERNAGIDLLRMFAAFMIVVFHSVTQGGIVDYSAENTATFFISRFIWAFSMEGVNIFALISGYIAFSDTKRRIKYSRLLELWFTVIFYSLLTDGIFDLIRDDWVSPIDYLIAITPLTNSTFWYFSAFVGLYIFKPLLDNGIRGCEERTLKIISVLIILLFSFLEFITQSFRMNYGFSVLWLIAMYVIGATIRKCNLEKKIKIWIPLVLILILGIIAYLGTIYITEAKFMSLSIDSMSLIRYNSPTIMISSVCYLLVFLKIKVNHKYDRMIKILGMSTFSVYIVNCTDMFWNHVMDDLFKESVSLPVGRLMLSMFTFSFVFFVFVLGLDILRRKLFSICGINKLCGLIDKKIEVE